MVAREPIVFAGCSGGPEARSCREADVSVMSTDRCDEPRHPCARWCLLDLCIVLHKTRIDHDGSHDWQAGRHERQGAGPGISSRIPEPEM